MRSAREGCVPRSARPSVLALPRSARGSSSVTSMSRRPKPCTERSTGRQGPDNERPGQRSRPEIYLPCHHIPWQRRRPCRALRVISQVGVIVHCADELERDVAGPRRTSMAAHCASKSTLRRIPRGWQGGHARRPRPGQPRAHRAHYRTPAVHRDLDRGSCGPVRRCLFPAEQVLHQAPASKGVMKRRSRTFYRNRT